MKNGGWLDKYETPQAQTGYTFPSYQMPINKTDTPGGISIQEKQKQEGTEYTGISVVDYLKTKGYNADKSYRKGLAKKYNIADYDYSGPKNIELLNRLREDENLQETIGTPTNTPIPLDKLMEMMSGQRAVSHAQQKMVDPRDVIARINVANMNLAPGVTQPSDMLSNRMQYTPLHTMPDRPVEQGLNPAVVNKMLSTQRPMNQTEIVKIPNNPFGSITGGGGSKITPPVVNQQVYTDNGFRAPYEQQGQPLINQMFTGKKSKTSVIDMYPEINNQQPVGQFVPPNYVMPREIGESTVTSDNVRQKMMEYVNTNNIHVTKTPDDLTDKVLKGDWINIGKDVFKKVRPVVEAISPDLAMQGDSYFERQGLKNDDKLQETKTKLILPVETFTNISPAIITADTVSLPTPGIKDRYIIPAQIDLKQTSWGIRNREDYTPIETEGGDITLFNNFVHANEYFKTNTVPENASFIGVDDKGKVVTGTKKDFINSNIPISRTYSNKIVDFPTDANGKLQLRASSTKASNKHLSPVTLNLDENGKQIKGSMNLLIPKKNKSTNSFGNITGGRVIFTSPDGKESVFASGSADDIATVFKNLKAKGNYPYLTAYTLDNGTYSPGLRKMNGKITSEDLKAYQGKNATGSVFLYLKNGNYSRAGKNTEAPKLKYKDINMPTSNIRTEKDSSYIKGHPLVNEQSAIVLHHTGYSDTTGISKGQSEAMKGVIDQFNKPGESSHVVIDFNGSRYNFAKPSQVTFHAGKSSMNNRENVNDFGIGIEFQGDTSNKPLTDAQIESFVEYITPIIKDKKIPLENIITHKQIRTNYMKAHPEDKQVQGKHDVSERDYNRIKLALIRKGIYQFLPFKKSGGPIVSREGYKQGPPPDGSYYQIPGDTLYNPTPYKIKATSDNGITKTLNPFDQTSVQFPGAKYVNEQHYAEGGGVKDDRGQWDHPGEITEIGSNRITMQGVPYPVLGISDQGDTQMMYPDQEYKFKGKKVTEFPMAQKGKTVRAPIYTDDPNDPRLRAYGDTTRANQSTQLLLNALNQYNKNPTEKNRKAYYKAQDENYAPVSSYTAKVKHIDSSSAPLTSQNTPDGNPDFYFIYPKAVQPVIYKEPTLKGKVSKVNKLPIGQPSQGMGIRERQMPNISAPNVEMSGPYIVGYTDYDTRQGIDRGFRTAEERDAFVEELRKRPAGNYQPSMMGISSYYDVNKKQTKKVNQKETGGWLSQYK